MKKILYFLMLIIGIVGIVSIFFFPIYKFDETKIIKNNTEIYLIEAFPGYTAYRKSSSLKNLSKEEQEIYKQTFEKGNKLIYAVNNNDLTTYYSLKEYEILNNIYENNIGPLLDKDSEKLGLKVLTEDSSQEAIEERINVIVSSIGEERYLEVKKTETEKSLHTTYEEMRKGLETIVKAAGYESLDEYVYNMGIMDVSNNLLNVYYGLNAELAGDAFKEVKSKGITLLTLTNSIKVAYLIDKDVWNKSAYNDLNFFKKLKAMTLDADFYNPLPLLGLSLIYFLLTIGLLGLVFKGIKGMRGRRYPHSFIKSLFNLALCLFLILAGRIIPNSYVFKYHTIEYSNLLYMFRYGSVSLMVYIFCLIYLVSTVISVIGRFFKWGKKRKRNLDIDED